MRLLFGPPAWAINHGNWVIWNTFIHSLRERRDIARRLLRSLNTERLPVVAIVDFLALGFARSSFLGRSPSRLPKFDYLLLQR